MVNGLGVLGWGVGGIEAEAAMLGQPVSMLIPRVVGFKLSGRSRPGVTATDVVLTITEQLRKHGVVGKFVEFYGEGVGAVPLANRATIGNMSPEFGSTCAIFPIDDVTLDYLRLTGRSDEQVALVEAYAKEQGMWHDPSSADYVEPVFSEYLELDLSTVVPSIAGPKRPQDRIALTDAKESFAGVVADYVDDHEVAASAGLDEAVEETFPASDPIAAGEHADDLGPADARLRRAVRRPHKLVPFTTADGTSTELDHGACGDRLDHLVHQHLEPVGDARRGACWRRTPWSAAWSPSRGSRRRWRPGSKVVSDYYEKAGLWPYLEKLGLPPGRLRLHHLHRQLRPAAARGVGRRSTRTTWRSCRCCPATATSRAGSTPT